MEDDVRARLAAALASRYRVVGELGRGGMATVFRAEDLKHGRAVALKVLDPEVANAVGAGRFRREVATAARLAHPGILPLLDSGEDADLLWYTMPYVEAGSLRGLLTEGKQLPIDTAIRTTVEVGEALQYAHAANVIHRDVKPENILVSNGHALLADFGIARPNRTAQEEALTRTGFAMGTPAYMSPEQASGSPDLDGRADIYSLGCVLFEMLSGRTPFTGSSAQAIITQLFSQAPPRLRAFRPHAPEWLEEVVGTAIAPSAADRFGSVAQFVDALRQAPGPADRTGVTVDGIGSRRSVESAVGTRRRKTVGRERELEAMHAAYMAVAQGSGLLLAVSGEPGIGKTTLVEDFLADLERQASTFVGRGRCSHQLAGTQAYLPLLEALDSLRGRYPEQVDSALRQRAPGWHAEVAATGTETMTQPAGQAAPERMKRELLAFVQELTRQQPLALFLDDVHWADASTVELLAYLGTRLDTIRILIVATHRTVELAQTTNPFRGLKTLLSTRRQCEELALDYLDRAGVESLLSLQFPGHAFPLTLPNWIQEKTEGNPLFVVEVLRQLRHQERIAQVDGHWTIVGALDDLGSEIPTSVRSMIEQVIERLEDADRRLLASAAVAGDQFDTATLADVLELPPVVIEERLQPLEQFHGIVRRVEDAILPDGTPTVRYQFVHALYHESLLRSLAPSRRILVSGSTAAAVERRHGSRAGEVAGALALLFETARNWERAAHYFTLATHRAAQTSANYELEALCRRGLAVVSNLDASPARDAAELELTTTLGGCLTMLRGFAAPEVEPLYARARELCGSIAEPVPRMVALVGLWEFYEVRGDIAVAKELARDVLLLAEASGDDGMMVKACDVLADTSHYAGDFAMSEAYAERGIALYEPARHRGLARVFGSYDPAVACRSEGALAIWCVGHRERARQVADDAVALARMLNHPFSIALSLNYAAWLDAYRRDAECVASRAETLRAFCAEHGFAFLHAESIVLLGWAAAKLGDTSAGLTRIRRGIRDYRSTGALLDVPFFLGLLADACCDAGDASGGLEATAEGLAMVEETGVRFWEAELHRLCGCLSSPERARVHLNRAIEVARAQSAHALELRAAVDLARLPAEGEHERPARVALETALAACRADDADPEIVEARRLHQSVSRP